MAQYFGSKSKFRINSRMRVSQGGPLQLRPPTEYVPRSGDLRDSPMRSGPSALPPRTIDLHPGEWKRMHDYDYEPNDWTRALRNAQNQNLIKKLAKQAYRFMNPLGTFSNVLDVGLNTMDWLNNGYWKPGAFNFAVAGFSATCDAGYPIPGKGPYYYQVGINPPGLICDPTALDVPDGRANATIAPGSPGWPVGANRRWLSIGQQNDVGVVGRTGRNQQWSRTTANAKKPVPWVPGAVGPAPNLEPPIQPYPSVTQYPRTRTRPGGSSRPPAYRPPYFTGPKDTVPQLPKPRERKLKFRPSAAHQIYGALTEIQDALGCLEKNTSAERPRYKGLHQRIMVLANALVENPRSLNIGGFISCMVKENVEDAVIGKANKLANRITQNKDWTRPVGIGTGTWSQRMR